MQGIWRVRKLRRIWRAWRALEGGGSGGEGGSSGPEEAALRQEAAAEREGAAALGDAEGAAEAERDAGRAAAGSREETRVPEQVPELETPTAREPQEERLDLQLHMAAAANPGRTRRESWITQASAAEEEAQGLAAAEARKLLAATGSFRDNLEMWGKRDSETFAGKQIEQLKSKCSTKEVEAVLQRPITACQDFDEIRKMRKLLNERSQPES